MTDFIALLIIALVVGTAVAYIVRQKRRGVKCVGCTSGKGACAVAKAKGQGCSRSCPATDGVIERMQDGLRRDGLR